MHLYRDTNTDDLFACLDLGLEDEKGFARAILAPLKGDGHLRTVTLSMLGTKGRPARYMAVEETDENWRMVPCTLRVLANQMKALETSGLLQEFLDKSGLRHAVLQLWSLVQSLAASVRAADAEKLEPRAKA